MTQKLVESVSEEQAEQAVSAVTLINQSAMNMLRQIADDTANGSKVDDRMFSVYARALKQLKEVLDIKSDKDAEEQQARIDNLRHQTEKDIVDNSAKIVIDDELEDYAV